MGQGSSHEKVWQTVCRSMLVTAADRSGINGCVVVLYPAGG